MEDLQFFDFNFNLLHTEHNFSSVYWRIMYNGIGSFEGVFPAKSKVSQLCMENEYLVICQGNKQAIITTKKFQAGKLTIIGRTVNFLLSKRVILPFSTYKTDVKKDGVSLALYVIDTCCSDFVTKGTYLSCSRDEHFWRNTAHPAIEVIIDCLNKEDAGHELLFDPKNKKWVFNIYKGKETGITLSELNLNAFDTEYTHNLLDYATNGYYRKSLSYKGLWDPATNTPYLTDNLPENYAKSYCVSGKGSCFGITFEKDDYIICKSENGKWEKSDETDGFWVKISDGKTGVYAWESVLSSVNPDSAKDELKEKSLKESAQGKVRNLVYEKDFNLGDIILFSNEVGGKTKTFRQRINAVTIWYENGNTMGVKPEFKEV